VRLVVIGWLFGLIMSILAYPFTCCCRLIKKSIVSPIYFVGYMILVLKPCISSAMSCRLDCSSLCIQLNLTISSDSCITSLLMGVFLYGTGSTVLSVDLITLFVKSLSMVRNEFSAKFFFMMSMKCINYIQCIQS
jgi:hypothetical protein